MSKRQRLLAAGLVGAVVALGNPRPGLPQIPPGWEIRVVVKPESPYTLRHKINNRGQVVYSRFPLGRIAESEIVLFDRGRNVPLTRDDVGDVLPSINNLGHVAWLRGRHHDPEIQHLAVALWRGGELEIIAEEPNPVGPPDLNDNGLIVWYRATAPAPQDQVFLFDGSRISQITNNEFDNQVPRINQHNQIVWNQFNYSVNPWVGAIVARLYGETEMINDFKPGRVLGGMNDHADMTWYRSRTGVQLWSGGVVTTLLAENATSQGINNHGDVCITRFDQVEGNVTQWLYTGGLLVQISDAVTGGAAGSINDRREIAFLIGRQPYNGIALLTHPRFDADADFDADVDLHDYALFQNCFGTVYDGVDDDCRFTDADNDQIVGASDAALFATYVNGPQ